MHGHPPHFTEYSSRTRGEPHAILKYSVVNVQFSLSAIRWTVRSSAGPDPEAADQHLRHSDCIDYSTISGLHAEGNGVGYGAERGIRVYGGDADTHQVADAAPARSGVGEKGGGGGSTAGTGRTAAGTRTLQERRGDAAAKEAGGRSGVVESTDGAIP